MNKIEKIKHQINFLLEKTVENGATEEEMFSAIKKAEELMRKYSILQADLPEKKLRENCVLVKHPRFKTGFKTNYFIGGLADLFDCEHYWTKSFVCFFGYKEDVKLCTYFYELILSICMREKNKFLSSDTGISLRKSANGRTISSNFIKGFLNRIDQRLYQMYQEKKEESNSKERSLVLVKSDRVKEEFIKLDFKIKSVSLKEVISEMRSYNFGQEKAEDVQLNFAIENNGELQEKMKITI